MTDVLIAIDYRHCRKPGCGNVLPHFTMTIAEQRCEPQLCWTCQREENDKSRGPLTHHIMAPQRPATVVRGFQPDPEGPQAA